MSPRDVLADLSDVLGLSICHDGFSARIRRRSETLADDTDGLGVDVLGNDTERLKTTGTASAD